MKKNKVFGVVALAVIITCMTIGVIMLFAMNKDETTSIVIKEATLVGNSTNAPSIEQQMGEGFYTKYNSVASFYASIVTILGIFYAIGAWTYSKMPPFKIKYLTVFENKLNGKASYAFVLKNRKNFPVTVHEVNIYSDRFYMITKSIADSVTFSGPGFLTNDCVLSKKPEIVVSGNSSTRTILSGGKIANTDKLFVRLLTSNDGQTIKCKKIKHIIVGDVQVYDDEYDIRNLFKAKAAYFGLKARWSWMQKFAKKWAEKWKIVRE